MVTLNGCDIYLGKWNTKASRAEYGRLIGEWLGRRPLPRPGAGKAAKTRSPLYAIRQKCLDCSGGEGSSAAVKFCPCSDCSLWKFRFGVSPDTALRKWPDLMDPANLPSPDEYRDKYAR